MLLLTSTSDLIQVVTGSAVTTDVHASWADHSAGTITPGRTNTAITTAATTTVVASPGASTQRNVQTLTVRNKHASSSQAVTVRHTDGTTIVELHNCTLAAGESLHFVDGRGFITFTSTGAVKGSLANSVDFEFLGGTELTGSAVTTGAVTLSATKDILAVQVIVTGYSGGGDIASFRFNGDTGANYWSRYIHTVAGGTTLTNNQNASQTLARLFAITTTQRRSAWVSIINHTSHPKVGAVSGQTSSGAAATAAGVEFGGFEWVNTANQITSIEMRTAGGSITMPAGTGFAVWGRNI